ncbi:Uncharacterised protein [Candidatus Tiddalikarchaeum anstoanum]|nr:Uncharacterised protein [Candidatus Tiddalikarchaeum anstoanum]
MRLIFFILTLLLSVNIIFAVSSLEIQSLNYDLYSDSVSALTVYLSNTGDTDAVLMSSELFGFNNYNIYSSPRVIPHGTTEQVIFHVSVPCLVKGSAIFFSANFTYSDSAGLKTLNSTTYEGIVKNGVSVSLISPTSLDTLQSIESTKFLKLSYLVDNPSIILSDITINVTTDTSVYSDILSFTGEYSTQSIKNELFSLQPGQSYVFTHILRSTISGSSGEYVVTVSDNSCEFNREYLILKYQTITSTLGPGFNIQVADEGNYLFLFIPIFFALYCQKRLSQD